MCDELSGTRCVHHNFVVELPNTVQSRTVWSYAAYETLRVPGGENRAERLAI